MAKMTDRLNKLVVLDMGEATLLALLAQDPQRHKAIVNKLQGAAKDIGEALVGNSNSKSSEVKAAAKSLQTWAKRRRKKDQNER